MKSHRNTLIDVRFYFVVVVDTDWSSAITRLRELKLPCLKKFLLDHCDRDIDGEVWVQDYILGRTDENPVTEALEDAM